MIAIPCANGRWIARARFRGQLIDANGNSQAEARRSLVRQMTAVLAKAGRS